MAVDKASGTENLRANETSKSAGATQSPSGGGKDCGGTDNLKADYKVLRGAAKDATPGQQSVDIPKGVQSFDDDMGRN